jgi:biotin carboxylase
MNKKIMVLGAGPEQTLAIQAAIDLGYEVLAIDENPDAPGLSIAKWGFSSSLQDIERLIQLGIKYKVDGVFSHGVEIPVIVAKVAESLKLPGLKVDVAENCLHKFKRNQILKENGLNVPLSFYFQNMQDLVKAKDALPFPCILKPLSLSGARGVQLIHSLDQLFETIKNHHFYGSEFMIEEVLEGMQLSTESLVIDNKIYHLPPAKRNYDNQDFFLPFYIEDGVDFPAQLDKSTALKVQSAIEHSINALGIDFGAAKGDLYIVKGEPYILEMASRTSGGWFSVGTIKYATGIDILTPLLQSAVGDIPNLECLSATKKLAAAQRYWISKEQGILKSVVNNNSPKSLDNISQFDIFFPPLGTEIIKAKSHADRYAQTICVSSNLEEAVLTAEETIKKIEVTYE